MARSIDEITTEMAEHICDKLCRFPFELSEEELEDKCAGCKMADYIIELCNKETTNE